MNNMYLKIDNINEEQQEEVRQFLESENLDYQDFSNPLEMYYWEEAYDILHNLCHNDISDNDVDNFITRHQRNVTDELLNNDDIINVYELEGVVDRYLSFKNDIMEDD